MRKTWEGIREVINIKRRHPQTISRLMINGNINHSSIIAKNIANKIPKTNHNYREYLKEPTENSFILHQARNEEIKSVKKSKKKKLLDQAASQQ